jgi:hypothetical protein
MMAVLNDGLLYREPGTHSPSEPDLKRWIGSGCPRRLAYCPSLKMCLTLCQAINTNLTLTWLEELWGARAVPTLFSSLRLGCCTKVS